MSIAHAEKLFRTEYHKHEHKRLGETVTFYQVDDLPQSVANNDKGLSGVYNTFLDALDGSYCASDGGDAPGIDAAHSDPLPRGCKAPHNPSASGDTGVATYQGDNGSVTGCLSGSGQNGTTFAPYTPSGCPWVTSVDATQIQNDQAIKEPESALQTSQSNPGAPGGVITGGGFSNIFPAPDYQSSALAHYFSQHDPGIPSSELIHRTGHAYPDISAIGAPFPTYGNQTLQHYLDTSLPTPMWASIITLINAERQAIGKGPVGFINPVLYKHAADVLTDVRNGSIPGCGSAGFWDPATGMGTPRYPDLLKFFLSLP
ncbi:hypothetical protein B0A55_09687 [Friedmanniomyces simplex]|uniref:Peptidase S53 domain-containing protein n=1 Tax=Friedmanniomyces simplex TaxID=329884 RepID=A0A4U0WZP2_9PEZI|nr:hypothetical protein B0A55_09687 [Friedmanniomyces simplex]